MSETNKKKVPSVEAIREEMGKAESLDDFFGKEGIYLFFVWNFCNRTEFPCPLSWCTPTRNNFQRDCGPRRIAQRLIVCSLILISYFGQLPGIYCHR